MNWTVGPHLANLPWPRTDGLGRVESSGRIRAPRDRTRTGRCLRTRCGEAGAYGGLGQRLRRGAYHKLARVGRGDWDRPSCLEWVIAWADARRRTGSRVSVCDGLRVRQTSDQLSSGRVTKLSAYSRRVAPPRRRARKTGSTVFGSPPVRACDRISGSTFRSASRFRRSSIPTGKPRAT